jgi:hypothetical protein
VSRNRLRRRLAIFVLVTTALAVALAFVWIREDDRRSARPSLAELAAKNYRAFTPQESRRLVRYAQHEYRCLVARGLHVAPPRVSRTRIAMRAANKSADVLVRFLQRCEPEVGPPPLKATLQARPGRVLVYFPKWCLLDPTEVSRADRRDPKP